MTTETSVQFSGLLPEIWLHILSFFTPNELRALRVLSKSFARLVGRALHSRVRIRNNLLSLQCGDVIARDSRRGVYSLAVGCVASNGLYYGVLRRPDHDYQLGRWNYARKRFDMLPFTCHALLRNGMCSADDALLVVAAGHVLRVDLRGRSSQKLFALEAPGLSCMVMDHEQHLVLALERALKVYSLQGELVRTLTVASHPSHVGIMPDGLYLVADARAHRLLQCRSDGAVQREFTAARVGQTPVGTFEFSPAHFAIDGLGRVLVSSTHLLLIFSRELEFLSQLNTNWVGAPHCLHFSDAGRLYLIGDSFAVV